MSASVLTKNALWVAISSTLAAVCLWTAIMDHETNSTVDVSDVKTAIRDITDIASDTVGEQDEAGQDFIDELGDDLDDQGSRLGDQCDEIRNRFDNYCD